MRFLALIDGFNYFHNISAYQKTHADTCVKWLNYRALAEKIIANNFKNINRYALEVFYFSAKAMHLQNYGVPQRHQLYIDVLKKHAINVVLGEFKKKDIPKCNVCTHEGKYAPQKRHEEKHTDVNIAITLMDKAFLNEFDTCFLLSGDNDFVPVVKKVKERFSQKRIIICPPPTVGNSYNVEKLVLASQEPDFYRIKWKHIKNSQLPDIIGGVVNPWMSSPSVIASRKAGL